MAISSTAVIRMAAAPSSGPRPASKPISAFSTHRGYQGKEVGWADGGDFRPFLHRGLLNAGCVDGLQLRVGLAPPLQPLPVDHQDVDVFLADGLFPAGDVAVAVHSHRGFDGVALA